MSLPYFLFKKVAAYLWSVFFVLKSILLFEKAQNDQQYFLVLQRRKFRGFGEFEGLRVILGIGGLVLLLLVDVVATFF